LLHPAVRDCIEAVERAFASDSRTPPPSSDAALAKAVERLSDLYTTQRGKLAAEQADAVHLAAKREYFLASDAPKVALALDECAARSDTFARLATSERLRVIDLGAGVGATSVGFIAWLAGMRARGAAAAAPPRVAFHAIELGAPAARAYEEAVHAAATAARIDATITVEARDFRTVEPPPSCDLILCQTALNELLVGERHAAATVDLVTGWARHAPLLVIEPALWTTSRALMALRDDLLARGGAHVVAPCPHQRPCPMLAREGDWCHEARRIDPTPRVARIDRLVGRRDGRALFAFLATAPGPASAVSPPTLVRLVTDTLGSRGKTERAVCRADGELRLMRLLDREVRDGNRAFLDAERGALLSIEPMPPNDRISPDADVRQQPHA
jgi:hypothetical protein